jgi:DNA-binding transcriptional LysR family regulator
MPANRIRRYLRHGLLPQLAVFESVARLGSFTRAADDLFIAQPTVSIQMKKLSETLGVALFEQSGKKPILTDAGRELAAACKDIFERLEHIEERLIGLRDLEHGRLRIASTSFGKYFIPRLLGEFCELHPNIEVAMHIDNLRTLRQRIQENADDLYVMSTLPPEPELVAHPVLETPIRVYAPAGHRLAHKQSISFPELTEDHFLLREAGASTRRIVQAQSEAHGIALRVRMELASDEAVKQSVIAGLGIALLPQTIVDAEGDCAALSPLDVVGFPVMQHWHLAYQRDKILPKVAMAFIEFVLAKTAANSAAVDAPPVRQAASR